MTRAAPHSSPHNPQGPHTGQGFARATQHAPPRPQRTIDYNRGINPAPAVHAPRSPAAVAPEGVTRCRVRFELGRIALARVIAGLRPTAKAPPELVIDLSPNGAGWHARAIVRDLASDLSLDLLPKPSDRADWQHDAASDLWHIESADLRATLDFSGDSPRVLYASTPRLAEMGLGGGRYEVAGVSVERG